MLESIFPDSGILGFLDLFPSAYDTVRAEKKNISKFMLASWATPSLVQHGTVGPADYGTNMGAVCHKDVSE